MTAARDKTNETKPAATGGNKTAVEKSAPAAGKLAVPKPARRPRAAAPAAKRAPKAAAKPSTPSKAAAEPKKAVVRPAARTPVPAKKAAPAPQVISTKRSKSDKPAKARKAKLVRDSFTMPENEYAQIAELKKRCLNAGVSAKKSELLRAAIATLAKLGDAALLAALGRLDVIKTGRPAKSSK